MPSSRKFMARGLALTISMVLLTATGLQVFLTQRAPSARASSGPTMVAGGTLAADATWTPEGSPYVLTGSLYVRSGVTLTVLPGTVVKLTPTGQTFNQTHLIVMGGQLIASGTESNPVIFTSAYDDSVGGDSNGDGGATTPKKADWGQITFSASNRDDALAMPTSVINRAVIRYGGPVVGGNCNQGTISVTSFGRLAVSHSDFKDNSSAAAYIAAAEEGLGYTSFNTSRVAAGGCGITASSGDISGNVFEQTVGTNAAYLHNQSGLKFYGNWLYKPADIVKAPSRAELDLRNNAFLGGARDYGQNHPLLPSDLTLNWWGRNLPSAPTGCWESGTTYIPAVRTGTVEGSQCKTQLKPDLVAYFTKVIPALSSPPPMPVAGVTGEPLVPVGVSAEQTYGAAGEASEYGYRPVGAQADPVNTAIGAFITSAGDVALPAGGVVLAATRAYTSADTSVGPLGPGWSFGYDMRLSGTSERLVLRAGDGQRIGFTRQPDGSFVGDPGTTATLVSVSGGHALTTRSGTRHTFDTNGHLTLQTLTGQQIQFDYNAAGNLATATASGRSLTFAWSAAADRLTRVTTSDGRYVEYGYTNGSLSSVRDLAGGQTLYEYDAAQRLSKITSPTGRTVTRLEYDATTGRVTDQWDGGGNHTTFAFDPATGTATMTDARGGVWKDVYQGNVLVRRVDAAGATTSYEYGSDLQILAATNARGVRSIFGYTTAGDLASFQGPTKAVTTAYNAAHQPVSTINARGVESTMEYDAAGQLTKVIRPDPNGGQPQVTEYTYTTDGRGLLASTTDALNHTVKYGYNTFDDLTSVTSATGEVTTYTRDSAGRVTGVTAPAGNVSGADPDDHTTTYTHNDFGDVLTATDPVGRTSHISYDSDRRTKTITDAKNRTTTYTYDANGALTTTQGPDASVPPATIAYDSTGNPKTVTDPAGRSITYTYDAVNRRSTVTNPIGTYSLTYDKAGSLASVTDPSNAKVLYKYDSAQRLASVDYPGTLADVTYGYDANGNRAKLTDASGTATYTYDGLDQLTKVTRGTSTFTLGYDRAGNTTSLVYPDGTNHGYTYDASGRLTKTSEGGVDKTGYSYNANGQLAQAQLADGSTSARTFDNAGRITRIVDTANATTLLDETYTYDDTDNPVGISHANGQGDTFAYDNLDRLTKACYNTSTCTSATDFIGWSYDAVGNITAETRPSGTTTHAYNAKAQLTSRSGPDGTTNYTYNNLGQRVTAGNAAYAYDPAGRLRTVTESGTTTTHTYDGDGQRLSASNPSGTTNYASVPLSNDLAIETDGAGAQLRRYAYGATGRTTLTTASGAFAYHTDRQGSVLELTNQHGISQTSYQWEPYGRAKAIQNQTGAPSNPMQWISGYKDSAGLNLLGARAYDPTSATFTQMDPASAVFYSAAASYGAANPLVFTDTTGLWPDPRRIAEGIRSVASGVAMVAGTAALILSATGVGAPVGAVLGSIALTAGVITAASSAYLAWDTCTNGKGGCGDAVVAAAIDTATALPGGKVAKLGTRSVSAAVRAESSLVRAGETGARACSFSGATVVLMADGSKKPIEDVKVGDQVIATDPETGERAAKEVQRVFVHDDIVTDLVIDGEVIRTTDNHPFWSVTDRRFERANELSTGEQVLSADGRTFSVARLRVTSTSVETAYNLAVEGIHTYHVGDHEVLVHNTCPHTPNFRDPSKPPGEGWEWRGPADKGSWFKPETRESLHPDLDHPAPIGPHYDWRDPGGGFWRVFPDGSTVPK